MSKKSLWKGLGAGLLGAAAVSAYVFVIRPWMLTWGTTEEEARRPLPGDALVPNPKSEETHAITIHAPAGEVWPWVVQIGYDRAGWYSYDFIHRALGCAGSVDSPECSAERIIPELQDLKVGDQVEIAEGMGYRVAALEPERAMVLHAAFDMETMEPFDSAGPKPDAYLNSGWAWVVEPIDDETTRLIVRIRQDYSDSLPIALMMYGVIEPGSFIMERKTLLGIKERAEATA
jgi:hypothetical protein